LALDVFLGETHGWARGAWYFTLTFDTYFDGTEMNTAEGLRRISTAIRWIGYSIGAFIAYWGIIKIDPVAWDIVGIGAVVAVLAHLVGWVVRGFAEPSK
jgi:hypothetical protein